MSVRAGVGFFDSRPQSHRRGKYAVAISPDLAAWATLVGRISTEFGLDEYPQRAIRLALADFRQQHGRDADPSDPEETAAVRYLAIAAGGWAR